MEMDLHSNRNKVFFNFADKVINSEIWHIFYELVLEEKTDVIMTQEIIDELLTEISEDESDRKKKQPTTEPNTSTDSGNRKTNKISEQTDGTVENPINIKTGLYASSVMDTNYEEILREDGLKQT